MLEKAMAVPVVLRHKVAGQTLLPSCMHCSMMLGIYLPRLRIYKIRTNALTTHFFSVSLCRSKNNVHITNPQTTPSMYRLHLTPEVGPTYFPPPPPGDGMLRGG